MLQAGGEVRCHQGSAGITSIIWDMADPMEASGAMPEFSITHELPFHQGKRKKKKTEQSKRVLSATILRHLETIIPNTWGITVFRNFLDSLHDPVNFYCLLSTLIINVIDNH